MKALKSFIVYSCLLCSFTSCTRDDDPITEYQSCCGVEPVELYPEFADGSKSYLYIPNVFTPNADGKNDLFSAIFNDAISHFEYMVIEQDVTDNTPPPLLYQVQYITRENLKETAWNGIRTDGKKHKGSFNYTIYAVTKEGKAFVVNGKACAIVCDSDATYFKDKAGCFFPVQVNDQGTLDKNIKAGEESCFGR